MRKNTFTSLLILLTALLPLTGLAADELDRTDLLPDERALLESAGAGAWKYVGEIDNQPVASGALPPTPYDPGTRIYSDAEDGLFETHAADEGDRALFIAESGAVYERQGDLRLDPARMETEEWFPAEAEPVELEAWRDKKIFGSDNRTLWRNTKSYPKRAHVALRNGKNATRAFCSGVMIGPRHVLTAGHCLHKNGSFTKSRSNLRVVFGQDGSGNSSTATPFNKRTVVGWFFPKGWINNGNYRYDYAMLILGDSTFSPGWLGFKAFSFSTLKNLKVNINGYPGHNHTCAASPRGDKKCGGYLYHGFGPIKHVFTGSLWTKVDWQSGQSGSPVYWYKSSNNSRRVVGVVSRHSNLWNKATRMRGGMANALCDWIGDFPSSHFNHNCQ